MANPQKKNGFTKYPNDFLEKITASSLTKEEIRIVMLIARYTWGYNKEMEIIEQKFIAEKLGRNKGNVSRTVKNLFLKNALIYNSTTGAVGINQNYEAWIKKTIKEKTPKLWGVAEMTTKNDNQELQPEMTTKNDNQELQPKMTTKTRKNDNQNTKKAQPNYKVVKENNKENIKKECARASFGEFQNVKLSETEKQKLENENGKEKTKEAINFLSLYKAEKGYKTKSDYLTLNRWVLKAVEERQAKPPPLSFSAKIAAEEAKKQEQERRRDKALKEFAQRQRAIEESNKTGVEIDAALKKLREEYKIWLTI
ncbi:replication protein [Endomicrobium proavitum]|uniref:Bacteriophage lambda Replication protein O N-terminal domain-containing protein n=1 Tax=Endomicrobium proavitum TaxID=1408281 RepID=A0A0G3WLA0_9BACT|nr:replication protein [Endomicrobium proavitum]AKL98284.1 hypothetical protein Epro_0905 [Endomicrobium proavitum]